MNPGGWESKAAFELKVRTSADYNRSGSRSLMRWKVCGYARIPVLIALMQGVFGMIMRSFLAFWMLALVSVGVLADSIQEAKKPVDHLNQELIALMRGGKQLGYEGRLKKIDPTVRQSFMFEAVAQIALGTHWKKLDEAQKLEFMDKYRELSSSTYASQFKEYDGENFEFESGQELKPGRVVLRYNLTAPKEKHTFEYHVSQFNGDWRVVNIVVDGISDLALRKAQYTSVIDREGFEALIAKLVEKIADTAKNNAG